MKGTGMLRTAITVTASSLETPMGDDAQRGAWQLAAQSRDVGLLSALIARPDLPADLVDAAGKLTEPALRVAYLTRPGITYEQLLDGLALERRASVLADACCSKRSLGGRQAICDLLEAQMRRKPSKLLAEAIIGTVGGPPVLYALAVGEIMPRYRSWTGEQRRDVRKCLELIAADPAAVELLLVDADGVATPALPLIEGFGFGESFGLVACSGLSERARLAIVAGPLQDDVNEAIAAVGAAASPPVRARPARRPNVAARVSRLVNTMLVPSDVTQRVLDAIRVVIAPLLAAQPGLASSFAIDGYDPGERSAGFAAERERVVRAGTSSDPVELLAISNAIGAPGVAAALASNPCLSGESLSLTLRFLAAHRELGLALDLARRAGGACHLVEVYAANPAAAVELDGWASFPDPVEARNELVRVVAASGGWAGLARVLSFVPDGDPILGCVPWSFLEQALGSSMREHSGVRKVCDFLVAEQDRVLGATPERWGTLAVLAPGFSGSVSELVATAATL